MKIYKQVPRIEYGEDGPDGDYFIAPDEWDPNDIGVEKLAGGPHDAGKDCPVRTESAIDNDIRMLSETLAFADQLLDRIRYAQT